METPGFDETRQRGTDFSDPGNVAEYDAKMTSFRDYAAEAAFAAKLLELKPDDLVLDIGCGTGGVSVLLARSCGHLTGIDVSPAMLEAARHQAAGQRVLNADFRTGGFLKNDMTPGTFDAVLTNAALHHLPDFWKAAALLNVNRLLKEGGRFLLGDVIFSFPPEEYAERTKAWIARLDPKGTGEARTHLEEEYSTYAWAMEGILERAGFSWKRLGGDECFGIYLCRKVRSFPTA